MKPFLSKEQAEFLREKLFDSTMLQTRQVGVSRYMDWPDVVGEINQCTKKEFPGFKFVISDNNDELDWVEIAKIGEDRIYMSGSSGDFNFTIGQFKICMQGCNKIVEWLEENEKIS